MSTIPVLAVAGSLRRGSYNRLLLEAAAGCASPGLAIRIHPDLSAVPLFSEDLEGDPAAIAPVVRLRDAVASARGLLISTPEYNQSIPGVLKNAIDWLSRFDVLEGKPVAVMGATTGRWGTRLAQSALRHTLRATGAIVLPGPDLYVAGAERAFEGGRLTCDSIRGELAALLASFGRWISSTGPIA